MLEEESMYQNKTMASIATLLPHSALRSAL